MCIKKLSFKNIVFPASSWTFLSKTGIFFNLKYTMVKNTIITSYCSLVLLVA